MNVEASPPPESMTHIASLEQLAAAREARGWSMSDVASKLGMMPRQIDAIEHGRWEALPGDAFVRGAIRAYGKALQLDVAPLLATLGPRTGAPELKPSSSLDSPLPRHGALGFDNGGSGSRIVWIALGVIGVIAIAMYFGRGADFGQVLERGGSGQTGRAVDVVPLTPGPGSGGSASDPTHGVAPAAGGVSAPQAADNSGPQTAGNVTPQAADPSTSKAADAPAVAGAAGSGTSAPAAPGPGAAPVDASAAGASAVAGGASSSASGAAPSGVAAAAGPVAAPAGSAAPGVAESAAQGASPVAADSLVLRFERESWVDVRDASGRILLMGTQPANSARELSGHKPYSLTIGNAAFVRVEHGGRNVDLGAVTQKGVARVRVE